ncbi:MAG TPA: AroM family protein [Candidatus Flavonifractor intestinipullorum]|uniref:AroM family protein n=1 Tax=Candidatus Flavonifractor intestinipullorum TaxID=2838587 RepID=A0A9D2M882_9FIRM|nr:AroM family protein [Candidatus Flavonifractor intestinipullorum]
MSEPKLLAAITIGQAPRTDVTADILPMLPPHVTLREYGALDELTWEQVMDAFHPAPGEQVLVSRMRDGRQVRMTEGYVLPRLQAKIRQAEEEGADAILLLCTGSFPAFPHRVLLLEPQEMLHAVVAKLAGGQKVGLLVPMPDQVEQAYRFWGEHGVDVTVACASPYLDFEGVRRAAQQFRGQDLAFVCTDCMGYTVAMKRAIQQETGLPVILPRTLVVRVLGELLD